MVCEDVQDSVKESRFGDVKKVKADLIVYHGGCSDGWCAAYIASKRFPEAELFPAYFGGEKPDVKKRHVLMLDFSYPRAVLEEMNYEARSLFVIDHHKTAEEDLKGLDYVMFDMNRSGAGMTFDYFFGDHEVYRPWYVDYVEDRDLWKFALPESRLVSAYLGTLPLTIEAWDKLKDVEVLDAVTGGASIQRHIDNYVNKVAEQAQWGVFGGYTTLVVNAAYPNCSEVGEALVTTKGAQVGMIYFERHDQLIQFSLRANKNAPSVDVRLLAERFPGGGGHKVAAGFELPYREGRKLIDKILGRSSEYVQ